MCLALNFGLEKGRMVLARLRDFGNSCHINLSCLFKISSLISKEQIKIDFQIKINKQKESSNLSPILPDLAKLNIVALIWDCNERVLELLTDHYNAQYFLPGSSQKGAEERAIREMQVEGQGCRKPQEKFQLSKFWVYILCQDNSY